jgi:hypothetical protein
MRVKVHGGTADHGAPSLCTTCRYATIIRGAGLNQELVECNQLFYLAQRVGFVRSSELEDKDRFVLDD